MTRAMFLALGLTLGSASLGSAHPGRTAFAIPVSGLKIDGQLDDWPKGMASYPIDEISGVYNPAPLSGPQDFSAAYQVGYDARANTLYLGIVVTDDELVTHPDAPAFSNQDLCEVYIDADHSGKDQIVITDEGGRKSSTAGAQQYMMVAGPGLAFDQVDTNPALIGDVLHRSGVKAAFRREGTTTVYEWAIPLFVSFPDQPFEARAGKTLGFDVALTDADGDEPGNWVSWSPGVGKVFDAGLYGNLVLVKDRRSLGTLAGTLAEGQRPGAGLVIEVYQQEQLLSTARTDSLGRYRLCLLPGAYTLKLRGGQGYQPATAALEVKAGREVAAPLSLTSIVLPAALKQMIAAYQGLQSYADTTWVEDHMTAPGTETHSTTAMCFAWARPNRLRLERPGPVAGMTLVSDGDSLVQYFGPMKQYLKQPAPAVLSLAALPGFVGIGTASLLPTVLLSPDPEQALLKGAEQIAELGQEQLGGVPMAVVELRQSLGAMGQFFGWADQVVPVRLWIGAEDHLLHQVVYEIDMGAMVPGLPAEIQSPMAGVKRGVVERHAAIQVNGQLPAETFVFTPPAGARQVERFGGMPEGPDEKAFVGKPAPAFALKDLEGKEQKMADFAGKVLIVDFWATWCGPCKVELPTFVALHSQYSAQGFSVIGLSTDDQAQTVRAFAEKNKISYPLLMADAKVRQDYGNITALPTTFVIDKKGVVRYVHIGTPPDMLVFQQQVEELLGE